MTLFKKKLLTSSLLVVTAVGVVFSQPTTVDDPTEVSASTLSFQITANSFGTLPGLNSGVETIGSVDVNGVSIAIGVKYASKDTDLNLSKNNSGVLYNIDPFPGTIGSIQIAQSSGQKNELFLGNSGRIINAISGDVTPISGTFINLTPTFEVASPSQTYQISTNTTYPQIASPTTLSYFAIKAAGGTNSPIISLTFNMTVSATLATADAGNAYTYALDFLELTQNKNLLCTNAGLKWSVSSVSPTETTSTENPQTLQGKFIQLPEQAQTAFRTATEIEIVQARERYLYLRGFNSSLVNFASL